MHINFNHLKTFYNALVHKMKSFRGNWEQNDPTAEDYIKNRPFYTEEPNEVLYVNKLTRYEYENYPTLPCNFIPGERYIVIWNGKRYDDVVCISDGSYNILGSYDSSYPFYIDDDGGDCLYISADGDFTVSIYIDKTVIHKIDSKYLPDDLGMPDDVVTEDELEDAFNNRLATVAKSGSYNDLKYLPTIYTDVVRYNQSQNLTTKQKQQARDNIGAADSSSVYTDVVRYNSQTLTDAQKLQARTNIGAGDGNYNKLTNVPEGLIKHASLRWNEHIGKCCGIASNNECSITIDNYGRVWRSTDNVSWSQGALLQRVDSWSGSYDWYKVVCCNGKFFALCESPSMAYSDDGLKWSISQVDFSVQNIVYGKDKFVAVGYFSGLMYSSDAKNWTEITIPSSMAHYQKAFVFYHNNEFVAIFGTTSPYNNNATAARSSDGVEWEFFDTTLILTEEAKICYGNGTFVACNRDKLLISKDGIDWEDKGYIIADNKSLQVIDSDIIFYNNEFYTVAINVTNLRTRSYVLKLVDESYWSIVETDELKEYFVLGRLKDSLIAYGFPQKKDEYFISKDGQIWTDEVLQFHDGTISTEKITEILKPHIVKDNMLPNVTEADNGKVLCVVDGQWKAVLYTEIGN